MAWLFERTIECAAWVAMISAWVCAALAVVWFMRWCHTLSLTDPDHTLIGDTAWAAGAFVAFSLALGGLACVDRFLFDADEN